MTSNNPLCYSHLLVLPCSDGWVPMSCHTILGCEKNHLFRKQAVISWNNNQHGLCNLLFSGKWCHQKHAIWPHLFTHQTAEVVFSYMYFLTKNTETKCSLANVEGWKEIYSVLEAKNCRCWQASWKACFPEDTFIEKLKGQESIMQTLRGRGFPGPGASQED